MKTKRSSVVTSFINAIILTIVVLGLFHLVSWLVKPSTEVELQQREQRYIETVSQGPAITTMDLYNETPDKFTVVKVLTTVEYLPDKPYSPFTLTRIVVRRESDRWIFAAQRGDPGENIKKGDKVRIYQVFYKGSFHGNLSNVQLAFLAK